MQIQEITLADMPFGIFGDTSTDYPIESMADTRFAEAIRFVIESTLDQDVTIQVIGASRNEPSALAQSVAVGSSFTQDDGSSTTSINTVSHYIHDGWHPWMGIMLTTGLTAPTAGRIHVSAQILGAAQNEVDIGASFQQMAQAMAQLAQGQQQIQQVVQELLGRPALPSGFSPPGRSLVSPFFGQEG